MYKRPEEYAPKNEMEREIEQALLDNGYVVEEIEFRDNFDFRMLRVGMWEPLEKKAALQISGYIEDIYEDWEEDRGYSCGYRLVDANTVVTN